MNSENKLYSKNIISVFSLFSILLFFPSITFGLYSSEIFPWAFLFSIIYLKKINKPFLFIVFLFLFFFTYSIITNFQNFSYFEGFRSLGAYFNSILPFFLILSLSLERVYKLIRVAKYIFYFLLILGLLQFFGLIDFLDPFFKFFIPSSSASLLVESNRGVNLFAIEPARAGNELIFLYILFRTVFLEKNKKYVYDLFFGLYLLLIIKSAMVILFYAVFMVLTYRKKITIPILISILIFPFIRFDSMNGGRAIDLFIELISMENKEDILFTLVNTSGHRLISIYTSFLYGFVYPLGGGIGNWEQSSVDALNLAGIDLSQFNYFKLYGNNFAVGIRASGFISNLVIDIGIIGMTIFLYYLYKNISKFWRTNKDSKNIIMVFVVKIFFIGSVGNPVAWVVTIVCLRYLFEKNNFDVKYE